MSSDDDPHEHPGRAAGTTAIVLAAGRGTRMRSARPKVLHRLAGRAVASHVLHALARSGIASAVVVIAPGEAGQEVREDLGADLPSGLTVDFAVQPEANGTGGAILAARPAVDAAQLLIVNGDLPLIAPIQLTPLLQAPPAKAVIATAVPDDPAEMGRIERDRDGRVAKIAEIRGAVGEERARLAAIPEVNVGIYRFDAAWLWQALDQVADINGEYHATAVFAQAAEERALQSVQVPLPDGRLNVEDLPDAARAEPVLHRRVIDDLLRAGVEIRDPAAAWIDATACIAAGVVIEPGTHIRGRTVIGPGTRIGPNAVVENVRAGAQCAFESCTIRDSTLGDRVEVGPYSVLRPGCRLADDVHIGSHAELKDATLGRAVQVGHFSYVGDAVLGDRVNVGAGAVTCNFDGAEKHRTTIGDDAFIGSDTMLVAPVAIGARARTGAGAVVTKDVPDDGNAVGHPARPVPSKRQRSTER